MGTLTLAPLQEKFNGHLLQNWCGIFYRRPAWCQSSGNHAYPLWWCSRRLCDVLMLRTSILTTSVSSTKRRETVEITTGVIKRVWHVEWRTKMSLGQAESVPYSFHLASHCRTVTIQSFHFTKEKLEATLTVSTFAQSCLYSARWQPIISMIRMGPCLNSRVAWSGNNKL